MATVKELADEIVELVAEQRAAAEKVKFLVPANQWKRSLLLQKKIIQLADRLGE